MNYPYVSYLKVEEKNLAKNFAEEHELYFASPRQIRIAKGIKPVIWISQEKILLQDLDDKNSKPFYSLKKKIVGEDHKDKIYKVVKYLKTLTLFL